MPKFVLAIAAVAVMAVPAAAVAAPGGNSAKAKACVENLAPGAERGACVSNAAKGVVSTPTFDATFVSREDYPQYGGSYQTWILTGTGFAPSSDLFFVSDPAGTFAGSASDADGGFTRSFMVWCYEGGVVDAVVKTGGYDGTEVARTTLTC